MLRVLLIVGVTVKKIIIGVQECECIQSMYFTKICIHVMLTVLQCEQSFGQ